MTAVNNLYIIVNGEEIAVSEKLWSKFLTSSMKSFPPLNIDGKLYRLKSMTTPSPNHEGGVNCSGEVEEVEE